MFGKAKDILRGSLFYKTYKSLESKFASLIHNNPSKDIIVIGVTGTDGKSTTSNLIHKILNDNLGKTALFTTVNNKFGDEVHPNNYKMTNISAYDTQEFIQTAVEKGCKYLVLEVSSHGIDQKRVANIEYDAAVLTNITEEHLDYHKNLLDYANTKKQLFTWVIQNNKGLGIAVLNKDDDFGKQWNEELPFKRSLTYSIFSTSNFRGENIEEFIDHTTFDLQLLNKQYHIKLNLLGRFNVYNTLAALSLANSMKIDIEKAIKSIEEFEQLNGRMNVYKDNKGATYFIDYAHTPAALNAVLTFLNSVKKGGKIITVFGAPGKRDQEKRPKMGNIVDKLSDIVILTDDDPDTEPRKKIIEQVAKGIKRKLGDDFWIMEERELAVELAYDIAKEGDIVLIAGKGHETVQLTNLGKRHYSDLETLLNLINKNENKSK